jgi:hypothetical protein
MAPAAAPIEQAFTSRLPVGGTQRPRPHPRPRVPGTKRARSPASPDRTAPTWPSCCSRRATRCTASCAARPRSTPTGSTTSTATRTSPTSNSSPTTATCRTPCP